MYMLNLKITCSTFPLAPWDKILFTNLKLLKQFLKSIILIGIMQGSCSNQFQHAWNQNSIVDSISSQGWNCRIGFEVLQLEISAWCTDCSLTSCLQIIFKLENQFHILPYVNSFILEIHEPSETYLLGFQNWFPMPLWTFLHLFSLAPLPSLLSSILISPFHHMFQFLQTYHIFFIVCLFTQNYCDSCHSWHKLKYNLKVVIWSISHVQESLNNFASLCHKLATLRTEEEHWFGTEWECILAHESWKEKLHDPS